MAPPLSGRGKFIDEAGEAYKMIGMNNLSTCLTVVFAVATFLFSGKTFAQSRCQSNEGVRGCVASFQDVEREQKRVSAKDPTLNLKKSVTGVFKDVNGKDLVLDYLGRHSLRIDIDTEDVTVTYNGEVSKDIKICYEACPNEGKVVWYDDKYGEFQKISKGLSVGGYQFKLDKQ